MAKKGDGLVRWYARCAREGKERGLHGGDLVSYVGECLIKQQVTKREVKEASE